MNTLRWLLIIILALAVTAPADAAMPAWEARSTFYRAHLDELPALQNSDGGFGAPEYAGDAAVSSTVPTPVSLVETVLDVHLLVKEQQDPYAVQENWEGGWTSLAASNVTNALDWLRSYESTHGHILHDGQRALLSVAYQDLGDTGNARRALVAGLDTEAAQPGTFDIAESAQFLWAYDRVQPATNATQNATLTVLEGRLDAAADADLETLSWSLVARPDPARAEALVAVLDDAQDLPKTSHALAAWGLAEALGPEPGTEAALDAVYAAAPVGLARTYYMLGELRAHPEFSPHHPVPLFAEGRVDRGAAAQDPGGSANTVPTGGLREAPAAPADGDSSAFPLPAWLMAGVLVAALAAVVVAGLAYGLKREDLAGPRRDIFNYIENNPGEHFSKIRRDLSMAAGTFQHHLSVLESEGWITSHKDARYKRYFVNGNRYQKLIAGYTYKQKFAALANETTRDFVKFVQNNPGTTQKMVAQRLQIHPSTVNWHAKRLKQAGILQHQKVGKEVRYHVDADTVNKMLRNQTETVLT